jgi:hypothetical protein
VDTRLRGCDGILQVGIKGWYEGILSRESTADAWVANANTPALAFHEKPGRKWPQASSTAELLYEAQHRGRLQAPDRPVMALRMGLDAAFRPARTLQGMQPFLRTGHRPS